MASGHSRTLGRLSPGLSILATTKKQSTNTPARGRDRTRRYVSDKAAKSFEPFAAEVAYINVNERLVDRLIRRVSDKPSINLLDIAAGTGLITSIAYDKARAKGSKLISTLLDLDLPALHQAKLDVHADRADFLFASADHLPLRSQNYDAVTFANGYCRQPVQESIHRLRGCL